jgi:hydroxylamine reductase
MGMFCYQCQEAAQGKGCTIKGVCGKEPQTSALMDLLLYVAQGTAIVNSTLREKGIADIRASRQLLDVVFCTITNANFDDNAIKERIGKALAVKNELIGTAKKHGIALPESDELNYFAAPADYEAKAAQVGVLAEANEDIRSLKQLVMYGVKGAAAYAEHALNLGYEDEAIYAVLENALAQISRKNIGAEELTALVLGVGECGVKAMA